MIGGKNQVSKEGKKLLFSEGEGDIDFELKYRPLRGRKLSETRSTITGHPKKSSFTKKRPIMRRSGVGGLLQNKTLLSPHAV
jgi:hypothetical protein